MEYEIMVSVIMPAYNRAATIGKAIDSVLNQTYTNWELVVVNDCSKDKTSEIVHQYSQKDSRIRELVNEQNLGVSESRNRGILEAKGKYVAFLDSDDEWFAMHLDECISILEKTSNTFCSALWIEEKYGNEYRIGEEGWYKYIFERAGTELGVDIKEKYWFFDENLFPFILMTDFYCFHINTVVIPKDYILDVGLFDTKMYASEDMDLVYRLLQKYNLITVNNHHFIYHYGQDNLYAYFDRNNTDLDSVISNKAYVIKLYKNLTSKIYMLEKVKEMILHNEAIKDKNTYVSRMNSYIYNRTLSCAYMCKKTQRIKALQLYLKALKYRKFMQEGDSVLKPFSQFRREHLYID